MKSRAGKAIVISVNRATIVSIPPRKYPATAPMSTPISITPIVESTATSSETRPP